VLADGVVSGVVTSGAPSPTLGVPIAMAYLELPAAEPGAEPGVEPGVELAVEPAVELAVDIRGDAVPADVTDLPFYRRSK
jgi:aminomethyltransferase